MDFKNTDIAGAPVITDLGSADAAASLEAAAALAVAMQAGNIMPLSADGQLVLPAGVGLDDIKVVGRDLVIQMPDGTQMIVPEGAVFVPQIVVDGVAVPPLNIAALLIGQEPEPAAGRPQSSGGNFADAIGDIGDPFALGDLLPPTQLAFPEPEEREIVPGLIDEEPTTMIVTPDQPAGSVNATASVQEAALPARGSEPSGSNPSSNAETTTGTIVFEAPDGLGSITLNGVTVTAVGQTFVTPLGTLTITSIAPGAIGYSYTLTDNTTSAALNDVFAVVVTDSDGDAASANLTINIVDDAPTARNDTDAIAAGTYGPQTGNVVTGVGTTSGAAGADTPGADGAVVSGVRAGNAGNFGSVGATIAGQYGNLTLNADGSYSYTRSPNTPGGVTDTFSYQITDGDGDTSTATLVISIGDSPATVISVPTTGGGTIVDEEGLPPRGTEPPGSNDPAPVESTSGTISFAAPDGVATVQINGTTVTGPGQVITLPTGTFTVTSYDPVGGTLGYTFTLTDNTSGDSTTQVINVTVTDIDGDSDSEPFTITIIDDTPTARNDSATQSAENAPVTVNVFANDTPGADDVSLTSGVALVAGSLSGGGALAYNGDGTFTYTPAPGEEGTVTFQYTITDGDGDPSTATVTIALLEDSEPRVNVSGENFVDEAGLPVRDGEPAGSNEPADSETTGGTIAISTGGDMLQSLVINGVDVTAGGIVTGAHGTLTVTVSAGAYSYSYTLADNTLGEGTTDSFTVVVTDSDGDIANDTLVVAIHDDAPTANNDSDSIAAGQYGPATGNVVTDGEADGGADVPGADGVTVTAISGFGGVGAVDGATNGQYGVLTLNADGSYSYTRNPGTPGGVSDVFSYTITDSDGDPSTATLTISIADSKTTLDLPTKGEAGTQVDEAGLPAGSDAAADSELTAGAITYTAPDGPATVTIDGVAVTAVGQTFTGSYGTLTITSIAAGVIGYEYELTTNTSGDATFDDFAVVVTDQDGDNTPGTLIIDIVDDVPTARADADSVKEDGPTVADGNVITGTNVADANTTDGVIDTEGADGATVTGVAFGAVAGPVMGNVGSNVSGTYGVLNIAAGGTYSYTLNNEDPRIQGLDSDDSLTETFTYTITDGDGDPATTTIEITINGSDDPITINGLNVEGPDLIVDEDDLPVRGAEPAGSDTTPEPLTQAGNFTVNGVDGIASIKVGGTETFVGQSFATAHGTFTITSISAPVDGSATAITIGYSYVLTDNTAHANADGENFLTEFFDVAVTDTDGSTDTDQVEVRIVDDVPTAKPDGTYSVAEQTALTFDALANDVKGADGINLSTGVAVATNPAKGVVVYNGDGTFTYTPNAGAEGPDSFTYTITDADGDPSTTTVTFDLLKDSVPNILRISNLTVDEDGLAGANVDAVPLQSSPSETDSTESATGSGTALVNFGADVPANLLASIKLVDTAALDGQLKTLDGVDVVFVLESGVLVGRSGGAEVIRIEISGAVAGPNAGDVTYTYSTTVSQPIKHVASGSEDSVTLTGVTFEVTDSETDTATGSFNVTVVDDVPSLNVTKGDDAGVVLVTQDAETDGVPTAEDVAASAANFGGVFGLTSTAGADGAAAPSLAFVLNTAGGASGLASHGVAINLFKVGNVIVGSTSATAPASATDASVVFSVAVSSTGVVTLTQYSQIDHALPGEANGPYDDQFATLLDSAITLTASSTITDGDNDTASDSETVNIGANISFADDGPVLTNASGNSSVTLDETTAGSPAGFGVAGISATSAAAIVTATAAFGADGAAAANATSYALSIVGGGVTSLQTAIGNHAISLTLSPDGKTVTGSYNDGSVKTAFTATINANGTLTVTQFVPLEHLVDGGPGAAHDDALTLSGLINATITITDYDGDTDSETVAVGDRITFKDDGPLAQPNSGSGVEGAVVIGNVLGNDSLGADGPDPTTPAGGVVGVRAVAGDFITPVTSGTGTQITGLYGTLTLNADGSYSYDGDPNVISTAQSDIFVYTIRDADGDLSTTTLTINLTPVNLITDSELAIVNEAGLDTVNDAGPDTVAGTVNGSNPTSNSDVATGTLAVAGATNFVLTSASGGSYGTLVLNSNGTYTYTLTKPFDTTPDTNNGTNTETGKDAFTYTATDANGNSVTGTITIDIIDDVPAIDIATSGTTLIVDESLGTTGSVQNEGGRVNNDETLAGAAVGAIGYATGSIVSLVSANAGADGEASRVYSLTVNNATSGMTDSITDAPITLVAVNSTTVEGRLGGSATVAFRITVDPATGIATINQFRAVEHNDSTNHDENGGSEALMNSGVLSLGVTLTDGDGDRATDTVDVSQLFKFEDDGPAAIGESGTANEILVDFNTAFVIDFSGSISNTELNTQLVAVKAAITALFNSTGGNVSVKFVLFASSAIASSTFNTAAAANAYLDSVNPATGGTRPAAIGSSTDFSDGITTLLANYAADETANNQVFFLSDGNPNQNTGSSGQALNDTIRPLWNSFVNNNDINVTAIGVGDGINNSNLQQIDVDGAGAPILVANFDDLIDTLTVLVAPTPITGDLDVNDDFGTDGGRILSITIPTAGTDLVYTWNGVSGVGSQITVSGGGAPINGSTSILGGTEAGGQFFFNFATGQWSYTPPRTIAADTTEVFSYTIIDGDGDTSSATLSVLVENNELPITTAVEARVDDDALTGGNTPGGTGDLDANVGETAPANPSEAIFNGTLGISANDSPIVAVSFAALQGATVPIGTETISLSWNALTDTLTGTGPRGVLFTLVVTNPANGAYTVTLLDNVLHASGGTENDTSVLLSYRVADADGSTNVGDLVLTFDDDTPVVTSAGNVTLTGSALSATGVFDYEIGADSRTTFSTANGDLTSVALSGLVGSSAITNVSTTKTGETATSATFTFSFQYDSDPNLAGVQTATSTGTLSFNKTSGQYTITLNQPIATFETVTTSGTISQESFNLDGSAASQPEIVVSRLDTDFYVRFTGVNGGMNSGGNATFAGGEVFSGTQGWVSVTGTENGVSSDTLQNSEVLNLDFYTASPGGALNPGAGTGRADTIFLKVDQLGATEDLVVILKLIDPDDNSVTTRAIVVDSGDIWKPADGANPLGIAYGDADGVIIIEGNDYNFGSENYQIYGAQLMTSTNGITLAAGTNAINLNRATGASGASTNNDTFDSTTNDTDVVKIVDIGFIQRTQNTQQLKLNIDVTVTDADGDSVSQTLLVNGGVPPVALDLDGDGVEFMPVAAGVDFDYDGNGNREGTAWVGVDDGLLAIDNNANGRVDNGSEIIFARDGLTDLEGLAADYDSNKDGVLDASDADFAKFGVWQDANSNGVTDAGEFRSLSDAGIVSIGLVSDGMGYSAAGGDVSVAGQALYTKADGSTGIVADASFATNATHATSRSSDQLRTSNLTMSVVAASLVGLAVDANPAAAFESDGVRPGYVVSEFAAAVEGEDVRFGTAAQADFGQPVFEASQDFVQRFGDAGSTLQAVEEPDFMDGLNNSPISTMSDLLADSGEPLVPGLTNPLFAFGGDNVMHSMLDIAALAPAPVANDNGAIELPVEDAVRQAMPDLMVDRLIDAFAAEPGTPANDVGGGAIDGDRLLAGMLDQGIDAFHISTVSNTDILGSHHYDMSTSNN